MKKVEEMKEVVVVSTVSGRGGGGGSGRCGQGICRGRVGKKSIGCSESIRNLFEQVKQGRGKLTMKDLCLSVIAPPLMEKIQYLPPKYLNPIPATQHIGLREAQVIHGQDEFTSSLPQPPPPPLIFFFPS